LAHIVQNLENTFGTPFAPPKSDLLTMLINIILSQATSDANSERTFSNLKKTFAPGKTFRGQTKRKSPTLFGSAVWRIKKRA
jgi:endonuclease III